MHTMRKKHFAIPKRDKHFYYAVPQMVQLQSVIARTCFKLFHQCHKYFFQIKNTAYKKIQLLTPAYADTRVHLYISSQTLQINSLNRAMSGASVVPIIQNTCPAAPSLALPLHKAKIGAENFPCKTAAGETFLPAFCLFACF